MHQNRGPIEFQELFGSFRAHARAEPRSGQDCCNFAHDCAADRLPCQPPANTKVYPNPNPGKTRLATCEPAGSSQSNSLFGSGISRFAPRSEDTESVVRAPFSA